MTHLKLSYLLAGATLLGGAFAASAGSPAEKFASMDANADGLVSEAEFVSYATTNEGHTVEDARAKFTEIAGGDGSITLVEMEAAALIEDAGGETYDGGS